MTLGDVLATVGILLALCVSAWALFVVVALLFSERTEQAADAIAAAPWRTGFLGLGLTAAIGFGSAVAISTIPGRFAGFAALAALLGLAGLGGAGVTALAARRIRALDPGVSPYAALCRGSALVVVPSLLPLLGWFVLGPAVLFIGVGAGVGMLRARVRAPAAAA